MSSIGIFTLRVQTAEIAVCIKEKFQLELSSSARAIEPFHLTVGPGLVSYIWNIPRSISLTYEKISEKMLKMKVIQNFVVINFYIIHFIDKVCWTSQILEEILEKKYDILLFVLMHWSSAPRLRWLKQNSQQKHVTIFKNF